MFERMVLSGAGRRDRRLAKFFAGSSLVYWLLGGRALEVSICVSDPKLRGSGGNNPQIFVDASQPWGGGHPPAGARAATSPRPSLYSPVRWQDLGRSVSRVLPP